MAKRPKTPGHATDADQQKVGYGRPPVHSRFKPGESGNPKGRLPGARSFRADLDAELQALVQVSENGQTKLVSKQLLVIKSLIASAIKGDSRAAKLTIDQIAHHGLGEQETGAPSPLSATDDAILRDFVNSLGGDYGCPADG